jgi:hypothetical protein
MDAYHRHPHRPGSVADAQLHIYVVGTYIFFHHAVGNEREKRVQDLGLRARFFKLLDKRLDMVSARIENNFLLFDFGCFCMKFSFKVRFPLLHHFFAPQVHQSLFFL